MRIPKHPTYKDTDRPILVGDNVIEPNGRDHEMGTYPLVVTEVSERYVKLRSLVNERESTTYPVLIEPADEASMARVNERLSPRHIDAWKNEMASEGVQVLVIRDGDGRMSRHLVRLPDDTSLTRLRLADVISPFVPESRIDGYDRDDVSLTDVRDLREPFMLDELVDAKVTTIDAKPMTDLEMAFEAMDRIDEGSYGETAEDVATIQRIVTDLATRLDMDVPERNYVEADWDESCDGWCYGAGDY